MTPQQYKRLTDVFWKSATETALNDTYEGYKDALGDLPPHAMDKAVQRALREVTSMPKPATLREWATAWIPTSTYRKLESQSPCPHCDAIIAEASIDGTIDGAGRRLYVLHKDHCPNPFNSKPEHKIFTDWSRDPREDTGVPARPASTRSVIAQVDAQLRLDPEPVAT